MYSNSGSCNYFIYSINLNNLNNYICIKKNGYNKKYEYLYNITFY